DLIETSMARVGLDRVLDTGRFDHAKAEEHPLWFKELFGAADHRSETETYGVRSFVYRARRPFEPARFHAFINRSWPGVIRAKG
ncbi:GTP-binding protein, partial [Acinetobacter baumannii]